MDVLVYSPSASAVLPALRQLLMPFYTVQAIASPSLAGHPWTPTCALLILISGASVLVEAAGAIQRYVEDGGKVLALGVGISNRSAEAQALRFYDSVTKSFVYLSAFAPPPSSLAALRLRSGEILPNLPKAGVDFSAFLTKPDTLVALWESDSSGHATDLPAGVELAIGKGRVVVWDVYFGDASDSPSLHTFLSRALTFIGLSLPSAPPSAISNDQSPPHAHPLPQILLAHPSKPNIVPTIISAIGLPAYPLAADPPHIIKDSADTFHIEPFAADVLQNARITRDQGTEGGWQPKRILVPPQGELPPRGTMPLFDAHAYFNSLEEARQHEGLKTESGSWGMGEALLYGELITSTQTLLDKNLHLLSALPPPLLSLATHQLAGRGRGSNTWLSPTGCLQFSLLLRIPLSSFPAAKLVFIQYLFGLALVRACRDERALGGTRASDVKLKWPNDIYIDARAGQERKKIGGILVNTSFSGGKVDVVIGCGLNVSTPAPLTSLALLAPQSEPPSMEVLLALIMTKFERMWLEFIGGRGSWAPFEDAYLDTWMHSDQLVTLTTVNPARTVRIVGITPDHGLLRTLPERTAWAAGVDDGFIDLQPDGNSFDLMAGLIKAKK